MPLLWLGACATGSAGSGCGWVRPVYVSPDDKLTEGTQRQILSGNEAWRAVCGKQR